MTSSRLRSSTWLSLAVSVLACQAAPAAPTVATPQPDPAPAQPSEAPPQCEAAPDWRPERIELPPAFAPSIPAGEELLWFAPGMFDPTADDYFSYVFELNLNEPPTSDPTELKALLHAYYSGLMTAVARDTGRSPGEVTVGVEPAEDGHYVATIEMTDEFTGGAPVSVKLDLERTNTCLVAVVTPSADDEVRAALGRARNCLPCATVP